MLTCKWPRGAMDNASVWRIRGPEIKSHHGQEFFILKFSLVSRAAQRDNAIANEINQYLANILFSLGISMYLLVNLSFKAYITRAKVHVYLLLLTRETCSDKIVAIVRTANEMCVGGGKRWLVTIVHYSEIHYSNNKFYSYLNAQMHERPEF